MHVTTIKREIVEKYPWAAASLVKAFEKAKNLAYRRVANSRITPLAWVRTAYEEERKILGPDPGSTAWAKPTEKISRPSFGTVTSRG
jgi:4,5-dihydroxyphthalate decarboxylase